MVASWAPDAAEEVTPDGAGAAGGAAAERRRTWTGWSRWAWSRPTATDTFRVDLGLLRLGVQLLDVPIAHETILAARTVLMEHTRAAAHELSRLFRDEVSERERAAVKALSAHMQPLVVQALLTAFQRSLKEELREWLTEEARLNRRDGLGTPGLTSTPNRLPR